MENQEIFLGGYYNNQFTTEKGLFDSKNGENFIIDDLLNFPSDDNNNGMVTDEAYTIDNIIDKNYYTTAGSGGASTGSSTVTAFDTSCNSSFSGTTEPHHAILGGDTGGCHKLTDGQFGSELCVPYDDLAELEWLSNFVEESFSSEDLQKMELLSGVKARTETSSGVVHPNFHQNEAQRAIPTPIFRPEISVPAKARSKRSRAAPCDWTSRLLAVSSPSYKNPASVTLLPTTTTIAPAPAMTPPTMSMSLSSSEHASGSSKKAIKHTIKRKENQESGVEGRRCLHCMTDKTPQWRTGPMGPKTLCNACGVRYKSGRLVPEYRPASSPTFMLTKHSNSHRKVIEIRRQNEVQRAQHQQPQLLQHEMMFDMSNNCDDYLIHQHIGPEFHQLI
ncbi:zinc finger transcription factor [Lithospermum erythrorhizon]|uniref:GATA transcription factor n=1 Tax=Lithospermum erythrorhizon TaxID=34254 RepID=A0AAV3P5H3_LITER